MSDTRTRLRELYMDGWIAGVQDKDVPIPPKSPGSALVSAGWEAGRLIRSHAETQAISTIDWALELLEGFEREFRARAETAAQQQQQEGEPWKSTN